LNGTATIAGMGVALPPSARQDDLWAGYFAQHYAKGGRQGLAKRIFANSGVVTRQAAVSPLLEDVSEWSTEQRMRRYLMEAVPLGKEAVGRALTDAGVAADELGLFAVCSCTGYATPGLDILLARDMGMSPHVVELAPRLMPLQVDEGGGALLKRLVEGLEWLGHVLHPDLVPDDRHGLADSIRGRMTRHGGTCKVRTAPGEGTEVQLAMPVKAGKGAA